jgi:hypothetical protein
MSKRILVLAVIILTFIPLAVFAQGLRVNNKEIEDGQTINLFFDDLDAGKINFTLPAANMKKVEITFDRGRSWQEMNKENDLFTFSHRPLSDEVIIPEFLLTSEDGKISTEKPGVRINYQRKSPDDAVLQVLDKMKLYYETASIDRFMSLFSSSFPNRTKFQEAIQNDFYNFRNMRLHYTIDRKTFDDDLEGAIWDVYWERKFEDRVGTSFSDSATIGMRFAKEGSNWMITGLRNNTIFGSSLLTGAGTIDFSVTPADFIFVNGGPATGNVTISLHVHNLGTGTASNVKVNYYQSGFGPLGPWTLIGSRFITSIPGGSTATCPEIAFSGTPAMIWDFKVVVDPDGAIPESDETNNTAQTNHVLP